MGGTVGSKRPGSSLEAECAKKGRAGSDEEEAEASAGVRPGDAEGAGGCPGEDEATGDQGERGLGAGDAPEAEGEAAEERGAAGEAEEGGGGAAVEVEEDAEVELCGICLEDTALAPQRGFLDACTHVFCFDCILRWSEVESRCPMCKQRFTRLRRVPCGAARGSEEQPARGQRSTTLRVPLRDQGSGCTLDHVPHCLACALALLQRVVQDAASAESAALAAQAAYANTGCSECGGEENEHLLLLCDRCDGASHTYCVGLGTTVPRGSWLCRSCLGQDERRRQAGSRMQEIRAQVRGALTRANSRRQGTAPSAQPSGNGTAAGVLQTGGQSLAAGRRRVLRSSLGAVHEEGEEEDGGWETSEEQGGEASEEEEEEGGEGEEESDEDSEEEGEEGEAGALWDDEVGSGESSASSESELDPDEHRALSSLLPRQRPPSSSAPARRRRRKRRKKGRRRKKSRTTAGRASSATRASQARRGRATWGASQQSLLEQLRQASRASLAFRNGGAAGNPQLWRSAPSPGLIAAPAEGSQDDQFALPLSQLRQAGSAAQSSASGVRTVFSQRAPAPQWPWAGPARSSGLLGSPGGAPGAGQGSAGGASALLQRRGPVRVEDPSVAASWRLAERMMGSAHPGTSPALPPSSLGRSPAATLGARGAASAGRLVLSRDAPLPVAGRGAGRARAPGQASGGRALRSPLCVPAVVAELDWGLPTQRLQTGAGAGTLPQGGGETQAPAAGQPRGVSPEGGGAAPRLTPPHEGAATSGQDAAAWPGQGDARDRGEEQGASAEPGTQAPSREQDQAEPGSAGRLSAELASLRAEKRRQWERHRAQSSHPDARPLGSTPSSQPRRTLPGCRTGQAQAPHGRVPGSATAPAAQGQGSGLVCHKAELVHAPRQSRPEQRPLEHGTASGPDVPKDRLEVRRNSAHCQRVTEPCSTDPPPARAPPRSPARPGPSAPPAAGQPTGPPAAAGESEQERRHKHKELVARAVKDRLHVLYRKGEIGRDAFKEIARQATHELLRELDLSTAQGANAGGEATGLRICARRAQQCLQPRVTTAAPGQVCSVCVESLVAERMAGSRLRS